MVGSIV